MDASSENIELLHVNFMDVDGCQACDPLSVDFNLCPGC